MAIEVSTLYTYPIKSCAGIELETAELNERGIVYDREWMVTRYGGQMLTQRTHPQLVLVQTRLEDGQLHISAPGTGEVTVPIDPIATADNEQIEVSVFKKKGTGIDQGKEVGNLFADYLQDPKLKQGVRLLRIGQPREVNPKYRVTGAAYTMGFADGHSLTLASMNSLAELNKHLPESTAMMTRFRPNIVVTGSELAPYDEDYWRVLRIGNMQAFIVKACARCPVPNVDPATGLLPQPEDRAVTNALRQTRRGLALSDGSEEEFFMQNLQHIYTEGVTINLGDQVLVEERSQERNFGELPSAPSLSELLPRQGHRQHHPVSELPLSRE